MLNLWFTRVGRDREVMWVSLDSWQSRPVSNLANGKEVRIHAAFHRPESRKAGSACSGENEIAYHE
jgi:hypothetical protein